MKIKISDMLDCSAEILTQETLGEQCDPDKICDLVFEQLEIKKRSGRKRFIAIIAIACILCGCVGAGILLGPGGKITDQVTFETEVGLFEKEPGKNNTASIESNFIEDQFLYDDHGSPIAKYVLEIDTNFDQEQLYIDNGTMLILHNDGKGIETDENTQINMIIEQNNLLGDPGTVEVGYIHNSRPYCVEMNSKHKTAVTITGEEGEIYYPYLKNISSDRIIIKIKFERE